MRALELTRSGIAGTIGVFVIAAVCVRLGFWQLDRREQRLERNAALAERLAQPPHSLDGPPLDTVGLTHRRVIARGRYDNARVLVLAGRSMAGAPGVNVLAPLRAGAGAILVNRGWLPSRDAATVDLSAVAVDSVVTVTGVLLPLPATGTARPDESFQTTWFRLDADPIRAQYPYPVSPLYLQAEGPDPGLRAGRGGPVPLPSPALGEGPHLSYAFQWFAFAVIFVVGWAALVMRRGGEESGAAGTTPAD
ncbi:MAG TPA: SURF1 family protein [Longimicrobiales bacterium]|nr:SURF1 family protein [Longimicrobiales bacterium]